MSAVVHPEFSIHTSVTSLSGRDIENQADCSPDSETEGPLLWEGADVVGLIVALQRSLRTKRDVIIRRFSDAPPPQGARRASQGPSDAGWVVDAEAKVWLQTSGTTGSPKWVSHRLERLCSAVRIRSQSATWLMTYDMGSFAGLQVLLHAACGPHKLVVPPSRSTPTQILELAREEGVTHISGTPTLWRTLLSTGVPFPTSLESITLGGEAVDQILLNTLREQLPTAAIRHIYATTECGVVFTVTDDRAGFPAQWLQLATTEGFQLSISENNTLQVASARVSELTTEKIWDTGDLVDVREDRVLFRGRVDSLINVGGHKVSPEFVEEHLMASPDVLEAWAYAKPSPITGALLFADVVPKSSDAGTQARIRQHAKQLPRPARPARLSFVERITTNATGKKERRMHE